jgi:3-phosphoshikimate 1-carboxyvinyltransferase
VEVDMADLSDVAQTLAVVAAFASSPTRVTGIGFIRHKETDRVGAVVRELNRLGVRAEEEPDGFVVHPGVPQPGAVATYDDHRMAMSFALLGLVRPGIAIQNPGCVSKTFPNYFQVLETLRR